MARSLLLLMAGALAGAGAVYFFVDQGAALDEPISASGPEPGTAVTPALPEPNRAEDPVESAAAVASRVAVYEQAVQTNDALDLEFMIDRVAATPRSRSRDRELSALLARLGEIDPTRAVRFAQSSFLETHFLIQTFESLARSDFEAALTELAGVAPPGKQREIAVSLLGIIGNDERGFERIVDSLPSDERLNFEIDALMARAEADPFGALQEIIALDRFLIQNYALPRLAEAAVKADPASALALSGSISDIDMRRIYENAVFRVWADVDPEGVFDYLAQADAAALATTAGAFATLAQSDPNRLLAMLDEFPPQLRSSARGAAMRSIATSDPIAALAMLDTMPPGQDRESMLQLIAQAYGRQDPDLAMAWAKSLSPPSEQAVNSVLQGIAAVDSSRAIDLFIAELEQQGPTMAGNISGLISATSPLASSMSFTMMVSLLGGNDADVGRLASRLLDVDNPRVRSALSTTISMWASRDRDAALNWALANAGRLDENVLRSISGNIANEDPNLAITTLDRLPPDKRAGWIEGLVSGLARADIDQAVGFLEQLRGQPEYASAYASVTRELARVDPVAAANMLSSAPSSNELRSASFTIAREWASRDPNAAARWALDLDDPQIQTSVLNNIAGTWAQRDARAAEEWIYSLNSGPNRDAAADGFMNASAQAGRFEPRLLDAYSTEQASLQGASRAIVLIGRNDPDGAKALLETYITDPVVRAQTEEQLARNTNVSGGIIISNGNLILR